MFKSVRIWFLKKLAKKYIIRLSNIADNYSCGIHMVKVLNPEYSNISIKLEKVYSTLSKIDPNFPCKR